MLFSRRSVVQDLEAELAKIRRRLDECATAISAIGPRIAGIEKTVEIQNDWIVKQGQLIAELQKTSEVYQCARVQTPDLAAVVVERMHELLLVQAGHPDLAKTFGLYSRQIAQPTPAVGSQPDPEPDDDVTGVSYG